MGITGRSARAALAIACALQVAVPPARAVAAAPTPSEGSAGTPAEEEPPCTLLELEGTPRDAAVRVSAALGRALGRRGLDDGRRASLPELRLAMGCDGDAVACLARGGKSLGSQRMLYGSLARDGVRSTLTLRVIDVAAASVIRSSTTPLDATALSDDAIDGTADALVDALFPRALSTPPATATVAAAPLAPAPSAAVDSPAPSKPPKAWWYGREHPTPKWQWAALGTSVALSGVFLATLIGSEISLHVTQRKKLLQAVEDSQTDDNPNNDISSSEPDLCAAARATPPNEPNPDKVTNGEVTKICNKADGTQVLAVSSAIGLALGVAATLAFTGVMLIHRGQRPRQRRVALGFDAGRGRVQLGLRGRF